MCRTELARQRPRLSDFQRKFYTVPYAVKDYRAHDEVVGIVLRGLVDQRVLRLAYDSSWLDGGGGDAAAPPHDFEPYTLAMYRGGLYLIGRRRTHARIVFLAVERIRAGTLLDERLPYPRDTRPSGTRRGRPASSAGRRRRVELVIREEEGYALLSPRRLHPTQEFERRPDGTALPRMTVHGTEELRNWILSCGPHVEVRTPRALCAEVARAAAAIAALYRPRGRRTRASPRDGAGTVNR